MPNTEQKPWYVRYAEHVGHDLGPNTDLILAGLERNKRLYGFRYCPCELQRSQETICPCKPMKETRTCRCELFVLPK